MKLRLAFLLFLVLSGKFLSVQADSPLTSTPFSDAYMDLEMVSLAAVSDHTLNERLAKYLNDEEVPIVHRLAAVNALGWEIDETSNFQFFLEYIIQNDPRTTKDNFQQTCTAGQLICLAYLKGMDDYFDVAYALEIAHSALVKDAETYSIHLIHGLIQAQFALDSNWCAVYQATELVRQNDSLKVDMNEEARQIIFEYMDLYKGNCPVEANKKPD